MFEGWAADVLASYLGKYLDLPRDRLRISLWGGTLCAAVSHGRVVLAPDCWQQAHQHTLKTM